MANDIKIDQSTATDATSVAATDDGSGRVVQIFRLAPEDRKLIEDLLMTTQQLLLAVVDLKSPGPSVLADTDFLDVRTGGRT